MRFLVLIFLTSNLLSGCNKDSAGSRNDIVTVEGDHFNYMLYDGLAQSIIDPINTKLEENYLKVLGDLEVTSMDKVTIRLWNNETYFLDDMEQAIGRRYTGASGWVYSANDIRILYRGSSTSQIALHEFCHAVSLAVNNSIGNNPRWLWEAVAIYESGEFTDPKTISYIVNRNFPILDELNSDFNTGGNKIYAVGYLLSEYIIATWGKANFVSLIKANGDIQQTLEVSIHQFEDGWVEFVKSKYLD